MRVLSLCASVLSPSHALSRGLACSLSSSKAAVALKGKLAVAVADLSEHNYELQYAH